MLPSPALLEPPFSFLSSSADNRGQRGVGGTEEEEYEQVHDNVHYQTMMTFNQSLVGCANVSIKFT